MKRLLALALCAAMVSLSSLPSYALLAELKTGAVQSSNGAVNPGRSDKTGAFVNTEGHAKYQEAVLQGSVFIAADVAGTAVTTQAGLSATTPALTLCNPPSNNKNGVLLDTTLEVTAAPAAAAGFILAVNGSTTTYPTATTAANIVNAYTSSTALPTLQAFRIATLGAAPVAIRYLGGTTGAAAIGGAVFNDTTDGRIIVGPGTCVSIQTTSATSLLAAFEWEEVPL